MELERIGLERRPTVEKVPILGDIPVLGFFFRHTTRAANEALFEGGRRTVPLRTWARHLDQVRERTVLGNHAMRLMHPFWERSALRASADLAAGFRKALTPAPGESWSEKLTRTGHAGVNVVRIARKLLKRGHRYRLVMTAVDLAGNASGRVTVRLKVR